jgi:hypothetical protein
VARQRARQPARPVELWCEDECRLGLLPIVRRVWAPKGKRPAAAQRQGRQWLYVFGFVRPGTDQTFWLLLPALTAAWVSAALAEWARWADPEGRKRLVLVWDSTGGHTAKELVVPPQVELVPLPPYTPELQPVEAAWPLLREVVANETFAGLDPLEERLAARCRWFMDHPESLRGVVGFDWAAALNQ